jgi:TolB protein
MTARVIWVFLLPLALCLLSCRSASAAEVYLGLQAFGGNGKALGVGIAPFTSPAADSESADAGSNLRSVMRDDILFTRLFSVVEGGPTIGAKLDSVAWAGVGAQVVVTGDAKVEGTNVHLECKIYDVSTGKILWGKEGAGPKLNARRLAHLMSDQVTFQLSGQPGIAHTRIAFVNNHTGTKEIYVMDYDGANIRQLTHLHSITILPKWSPDGKWIAFNSYKAGNPDAYLMDAGGENIRSLSDRQGLNTSPNWSPDGNTVALTLSRGGDPELYLLERSGQIIRRLTYSPGVDTSPSFSPNGQQIVFISDRAGSPEIYVMDITGANVQRLTYGQWADAPSWSPKGDWIAYERQRSQGRYDVYMIDSSGKNNHVISEAGARNENPTWSPDGRFLTYSSDRDGGQGKICTMGADGSSPHCVSTIGGESYTPSWGP